MDYRTLGRTGLTVSTLGFGCGNVGGIIIRGAPAERERAVARAMELGVNYFDTAPSYGDGQSETKLGETLRALRATVQVGTKFRIDPGDLADVPGAVERSLHASLRRLGLPRVDLLQCHNNIVPRPDRHHLPVARLLDEVVPALAKLRDQGKIRFYGITALGDTGAVHEALDAGVLDTAQVCLNLLNPTAAVEVPTGFPAQDFRRLLDHARGRTVGVIVIRALAAGALSATLERHPIAVPEVAPIASGPDYAADVARARTLAPLVTEGFASSLVEASIRFALASDAVSTVMVGCSSLEHLETAASAVNGGPLPQAALDRLTTLWQGFGGAARPS